MQNKYVVGFRFLQPKNTENPLGQKVYYYICSSKIVKQLFFDREGVRVLTNKNDCYKHAILVPCDVIKYKGYDDIFEYETKTIVQATSVDRFDPAYVKGYPEKSISVCYYDFSLGLQQADYEAYNEWNTEKQYEESHSILSLADKDTKLIATSLIANEVGSIDCTEPLDTERIIEKISKLEDTIYYTMEKKEEEKTMNLNTKTMFNNFEFGRVSNVKLSIYGIAIPSADHRYVSYDPKSDDYIDVTPTVFEGIDCYAIPVPEKAIKVGDYIKHDDQWVRITNFNVNHYPVAIRLDRMEQVTIVPTKSMFGFNFFTKLVTPFDNGFGGTVANEDNPFGNMLLPMLLCNKDKTENNGLETLALMQMMNSNGAMNSDNMSFMLPLLLADNTKSGDLLLTMFAMNNMNKNEG